MNEPLENKTPIPKAAQYADDILAGKITLPSLKGQVPDSWIRETKKILEAKGYLIVEDLPDMSQDSIEQSDLSTEQINLQIETAKETFLNETDQIVEQSSRVGITLLESVIQEAKQEVRFDEQISELKKETASEFDKISKKEYQWNDIEHIDGIDKYNMMVDIANGAKEGLKDSFSEKINQYVREINNGQSKDKVLQGLPQSFIDAVESKIGSQSPVQGKTEEQKKVDQIKDFFDLGDMSNIVSAQEQKFQDYADRIKNGEPKEKVLQGLPKSMTDSVERILNSESEIKKVTIEKITGVENMKHVVLEVGKTHYLFTHQTDEGTAKKIFESNFEVSPGTGINSTMTRLGSDMVINQIERQIGGDSHRGYKGMFILAVPKEIIDTLPGYDKSDAFEDYLLQSVDYGKDGNPNIVIPDKFNFAYLQGEDLFVNQAFDYEKNEDNNYFGSESESQPEIKKDNMEIIRTEMIPMMNFANLLEREMHIRFMKTGDPIFQEKFQNKFSDNIEQLKKMEHIEECIEIFDSLDELFTDMNNSVDFYAGVSFNSAREEIQDVQVMSDSLFDFQKELNIFVNRVSIGEKQDDLETARDGLMQKMKILSNKIDQYQDDLRNQIR